MMKVLQQVTRSIPLVSKHNVVTTDLYYHVVLFETNAGNYQVMEALTAGDKITEQQQLVIYSEGNKVAVKRAVELFGSSICEKMDWSDPE